MRPRTLLRGVFLKLYGRIVAKIYQIIAEAIATAYKGASEALQDKLRRVVDVWRQRQIFDPPILEAVEHRIKGKQTSSSII